MLGTMTGRTNGDNIVAHVTIAMMVMFSLIAAVNAWQSGRWWKLPGFYSIPDSLTGCVFEFSVLGLLFLSVVGSPVFTESISGAVADQAFLAFIAIGIFEFVFVGCVGVVKCVGAFFAPVGDAIVFTAILVEKISCFRAFAPRAILFLHKKASYQSWSVRLLRAYNHRQEAGKTIAALRLTVKNVCPEWS